MVLQLYFIKTKNSKLEWVGIPYNMLNFEDGS